LFDNSITLHNRSVHDSAPNRVGYRVQYDFDNLTGGTYNPFYQEEFNQIRQSRIDTLHTAMEGLPMW